MNEEFVNSLRIEKEVLEALDIDILIAGECDEQWSFVQKKKNKQLLLDGKTVGFKDFEILELIGEGSFGQVFKVKKKDNGQILALKVMKKQYLISNH